MKKIFLLSFLFLSSVVFSQNWETHFGEAQTKALQENKNILLVFSGSDWCAPCIKLEKNVWQSEAFLQASTNWVLYKADFPKKKDHQLPEKVANENKALAEQYNQSGNFPLVVLLDKNGKVLGMEGYKNVSSEAYIGLLQAFEP